ncbi:MAG: MFS transporter [Acidobacteriia bacterium]|nr:MFS transporter [Terriglobia bacterium]
MDGFDVQAMGYVAPAIVQEWKIRSAQLGPVFGAALFGVLIGSLLFSMLADKIGRRPVLIGVTLFFSALTFLTAHAGSLREMLVIRLIAGMGLGGIMPNAVALVGEYSPRRTRAATMMIVANGFSAGAAIGGFIAAWLIPAFGWRSVFYFGAAAPLGIAVAMIVWLPESLPFLVVRGLVVKGKPLERAAQWLKRLDPSAPDPAATEYVAHEKSRRGLPIVYLFYDGRAVATILLWILNFMNLLNLYFLASWLPTVVKDAGYSTSTAVLAGTTMQAAGVIGAVALGWLVRRLGFVPVLTAGFAVACVNIALIGQPGLSLALLFVVVFLAGLGIVGGQAGLNALAATYYPTNLRSTGIGAGLGVGRIGAIIGPVVGGGLMGLHWSAQRLFLAAAAPALISALVMLAMGARYTLRPHER